MAARNSRTQHIGFRLAPPVATTKKTCKCLGHCYCRSSALSAAARRELGGHGERGGSASRSVACLCETVGRDDVQWSCRCSFAVESRALREKDSNNICHEIVRL